MEDSGLDLFPVLKGLTTYVPGTYRLLGGRRAGESHSAPYCYGVWLKHISLLWDGGVQEIPATVAEIGPGASRGVGLAALLSGAREYFALDVEEHADPQRDLALLEELVELFRSRAPRPVKGWPDFDKFLDGSLFPSRILGDDLLSVTLSSERVGAVRAALASQGTGAGPVLIRSFIPWDDDRVIAAGTVDLILSHSVLEHVADLGGAFEAFTKWLKPGGVMSHQVDLSSHGLCRQWNGHWSYPPWLWRVVVGRRPSFLNAEPCSRYRDLLESHGFEVFSWMESRRGDGITRSGLPRSRREWSEEDITCSGLFFQARKRA